MAIEAPPSPTATAAQAERRRRDAIAARWPVLIMLVPLVLVCLPFWPGHMNADALSQIGQVRGVYPLNNHHAPLLMALWTPFYDLGMGPGWVLTAQTATFLAGCYLILRSVFGRLASSLLASAIALWPSVYGMLGVLGRDTWFTAFLVLTFGFVIRATQREGRQRVVWTVLAIGAAWLALASRQNAAPAIVLALAVLVALFLPRRRVIGGLVGGVVITVALMATQVGANAALSVDDYAPEQVLYIYDLGALSVRDHANEFPPDVVKDRSPEAIASRWNPDSVVGLMWSPNAAIPNTPLSGKPLEHLASAWRHEIREEPLEYLDVRWDLLARNLGLTAPPMWIYHPRIDANDWGYHVGFPGPNQTAKDYVQAFAINGERLDGGILHRVWLYLLLAMVAAAVLLWRGRARLALVAVAALGLTALTHQVGLFFGTPQNGYRLEFTVLVVALLTAAVAIGAVTRRRAA